jgi:hypothetical protein
VLGLYALVRKTFRLGHIDSTTLFEIADDYQSARIHVREAFAHRSFGPAMLLHLGGKSHVDVRWTPVTNVMGQVLDVAELRANKAIEQAEKAYKARHVRDALDLLIPHKGRLGNHGRRILLDAAVACEAWDDVVRLFKPPGSVDELVTLVKAFASLERFDEADWWLETFGSRLGLAQPTSHELRRWLTARREINR